MSAAAVPNPSPFFFQVPLIPPSVNHYKAPKYRGGFYITDEARAYLDAVCLLARRTRVDGPYYRVRLFFYVPRQNFHRVDSDNFLKLACDGLTKAGVISDDRYITDLQVRKLPVDDREEIRTAFEVTGRAEP